MTRHWLALAIVGLLGSNTLSQARGVFAWPAGPALNAARLQGCGSSQGLPALHEDSRLQLAARRLAGGSSLHAALAASGYTARQSFELHVTGVASQAQLRHVLTANFCKPLSDPGVRDFGVERRDRELWIAIAAPLSLPASRDAVAIERQVVTLVNAARMAGRRCGTRYFKPVSALSPSVALRRAAQSHSDDMAVHREFEHRGHDGSTPAERVERAGYGPHRIVGENIAAGAATAAEVTQGWLESVPHCENIMDPRFAQIGVAFSINTASDSVIYWTQDFAASP